MGNSIFLDTNIVLDMIENQRSHHDNAKALYRYIVENDYEIYISEDMLTTIYYIASDKKAVLAFLQMIEDEWQIVPYGKETINKALSFSMENATDLEDTLQCLCAKSYGCRYVITNDKNFVKCGIDVVDYESFFSS